MEQEEYTKEEINWSYIEFIDNQDVLDLIEKVVTFTQCHVLNSYMLFSYKFNFDAIIIALIQWISYTIPFLLHLIKANTHSFLYIMSIDTQWRWFHPEVPSPHVGAYMLLYTPSNCSMLNKKTLFVVDATLILSSISRIKIDIHAKYDAVLNLVFLRHTGDLMSPNWFTTFYLNTIIPFAETRWNYLPSR
jgi:hypothetical protein